MSIKAPNIALVFDRRKIASYTRKASVELRISLNYKQKYISTGVMLYSNQWKNGRIVNAQNADLLSSTLDAFVSEVRKIILTMIQEGNIDIGSIPDRIKEVHGERISFIEYCKRRTAVKKYGKTTDSQKRYDRFLRLFTKWGRIRNFEDITEEKIVEYDQYLSSTGMKSYSKWNNYHRFLLSFITDAITEGYLRRNPYKWTNISKKSSYNGLSRYLTPQEFKKIQMMENFVKTDPW